MEAKLIILLFSVIGGLLSGFVVFWIESRYKPTEIDSSQGNAIRFSKPILATIAAYSVLLLWGVILSIFGALLLSKLFELEFSTKSISLLFYMILVAGSVTVALVCLIKCDACSRVILTQEIQDMRFEKKSKWFDSWAFVIVDVAFARSFRCMSCGQKYGV